MEWAGALLGSSYLHVGDTFVGMPIGGYRSSAFTTHVLVTEYLRDAARVVYSVTNAFYTYDEVDRSLFSETSAGCESGRIQHVCVLGLVYRPQVRLYREVGSARAYFRDGWNWFDLVHIACVWMLLATEVRGMIDPSCACIIRGL